PTQSTPTDGRQTSGDNTAQSRPDGTPPRTDAAQPGDRTPPADRAGHGGENRPADGTRRDDQAQPSDGTPRGHEEPAPGQSDPRFRRGNVDDDGNTPPPDEPPARTDPPAGSGLPHQQADWVPPSYTREGDIDRPSDERIVDQGTLEPRTKYTVYEVDEHNNRTPRSWAYTDRDGNVTHVTNIPPENAGAPHIDPNENVDLTRPAPGVTHKVELGFDEPHIFTGEPHVGGDEGMAPSATRFDPPADATPVKWPGEYDIKAN